MQILLFHPPIALSVLIGFVGMVIFWSGLHRLMTHRTISGLILLALGVLFVFFAGIAAYGLAEFFT